MRILFVTPFLPSPPRFGAERRLDGLARELGRRHELSLLWFNADNAEVPASIESTRSYCKEVLTTAVNAPGVLQGRRMLQLRSLLSRHSFERLRAAARHDFQTLLDRTLAGTLYDVVQFEGLEVAAFRFNRRSAGLFVLDEHNIEYDSLARAARVAREPARRFYRALSWRKVAREERAAWRRFDGIALTSKRDQALLVSQCPEARTAVVPNGVNLSQFPRSPNAGSPGELLFFGALNYAPNQDAVDHFITRILPQIRRANPLAKLSIVGPGAPQSMRDRQGNGVELVGLVDDIAPYIDRAAAVVVPLRFGGGTRLKIVEALAKGKAVISTTLGAEGLAVAHEQHLLLADEPTDFARQVLRVLDSKDLATRLGAAGRLLVEQRYDWPSIAAGLERFYLDLRRAR